MAETPKPTRGDEEGHLVTVGVLITAAVALGAALTAIQSVAIPFVIALLLAYAVTPLVDFVEMRLRAPRWVGLVLALLLSTGLIAGLVLLIVQSVNSMQGNADLYGQRLSQFAANVLGWLQSQGLDIDPASVQSELSNLPIKDMIASAIGSAADVLSKGVLTLLFFIFIVISRSPWDAKGGVWEEIDGSVNRYLRVKLLTSVMIGVTTWGILFGFGVDLAPLFGVLALLLNFIPTIGSVLGILLAVPIIFVTLDPGMGLVAVGSLVLAQNVIGNGLEPKMMGEGLDLHPATILLALGMWGLIWGVVGMLLSAPLMAIIRLVLFRYETTRPFAELLAGRVGSVARK